MAGMLLGKISSVGLICKQFGFPLVSRKIVLPPNFDAVSVSVLTRHPAC